MKIQEFKDGFIITYEGFDYKYQGKSKEVIKEVCKKSQELLLKK